MSIFLDASEKELFSGGGGEFVCFTVVVNNSGVVCYISFLMAVDCFGMLIFLGLIERLLILTTDC